MEMNIIPYVGMGITLIITGANLAFWMITKFNDMKHLSDDVKEIKGDVKTLVINSQKLEVRMGEQEMKCKMQHRRSKRNREQK